MKLSQRIVSGMCLLLLVTPAFAGYSAALRRASRSTEVYNLDTVRAEAVWSATQLTPEFREARVAREAKLRRLDLGTVDAALPPMWRASGTNFFVTLFAPRDADGRLDGVNPLWSLELRDSAGRTSAPATMTEVKVTRLDRALFPKLTPWSRAYYVHFAAAAGAPMELTLRGPTSASTVKWK